MNTRYTPQPFRWVAGLALIVCGMMPSLTANAYTPRVHCPEDTVKVRKILESLWETGAPYGERVLMAAKALEGTPLSEARDNDEDGTVVIDLHGFDRLGFANTVLALAEASMKKVPTVREYELAYESVSRRKGEDNGFASQLIYGSDWIVDNVYRGHMKEMTEYLGGGGFKTKTLDRVTRNRDKYPALKDSATYDKVRMTEMGYRSHRIPHLKKQSVGNKEIHELMKPGDIIIMLGNDIDFDYYDIGFVEMRGGVPYLVHIPTGGDKVATDSYDLPRLFKVENQHFYGYRWLRPTE